MAKPISNAENNFGKQLLEIARKKKEQTEKALLLFLDNCIAAFDIQQILDHPDYLEWVHAVLYHDEDYKELILEWMKRVDEAIKSKDSYDFFGTTYEAMFQSNAKATTTGQFFTPMELAKVLALLTDHENNDNTVYDCCCGSGRLLLGHVYMRLQHPEKYANDNTIYIAEDIDLTSCKMTALNLMAHGCYGCVICHDVLINNPPDIVYIVNESKVPFKNYTMSIRTLKDDYARSWWLNGGIKRMADRYNVTEEELRKAEIEVKKHNNE